MTVSRKGRLALLISVALHAIVIGVFARLAPTAKIVHPDTWQFVRAADEPSMTTFVMGERTEVMDISPPVVSRPSRPIAEPILPVTAPPNPPAILPQSVGARAGPVEKVGGSGLGNGNIPAGNGIATTTFFEVPAQGRRIVYLIDHSASMGPTGALEVAGQELLASLGRLPRGTSFQVIVYNKTANVLMPRSPDWITVQPDAVKQVAAAWRDLPAEGGTDSIRALKSALIRQADVIFFLTDAGDVDGNLLRDITRLNRGRTAIHVIELNAGQHARDAGPLQLLARENRGTFQSVRMH